MATYPNKGTLETFSTPISQILDKIKVEVPTSIPSIAENHRCPIPLTETIIRTVKAKIVAFPKSGMITTIPIKIPVIVRQSLKVLGNQRLKVKA